MLQEVPEMQSSLGVPVRKYSIPLAAMTPDSGLFDNFVFANYGPLEGSDITPEEANAQVDIQALVFSSLDATAPVTMPPSPPLSFSSLPPPPSPSPPSPSPPPVDFGFQDLTPLQVQNLIKEKCGDRKVVFIGPTATEYTATDLAGECIFGNGEWHASG